METIRHWILLRNVPQWMQWQDVAAFLSVWNCAHLMADTLDDDVILIQVAGLTFTSRVKHTSDTQFGFESI